MSDIVYVVDRRIGLPFRGPYIISCHCGNCGYIYVALFNKGEAAINGCELCPFCEVWATMRYHSTGQALTGIAGKTLVLLQERDGAYVPLHNEPELPALLAIPIPGVSSDSPGATVAS